MNIQRYAVSKPALLYNAAVFPLGAYALTSTPAFNALVCLVVSIQLYTTAIIRRRNVALHFLGLLVNLSLASTLATFSATTTALPSVTSSISYDLIRSSLSSLLALGLFFVSAALGHQTLRSPWLRVTVFPIVWTAGWLLISKTSPVGRLGTWTPLISDSAYIWTRPYVGLAGTDFAVAASANVVVEVLGRWLQGSKDDGDEHLPQHTANGNGYHEHTPLIRNESGEAANIYGASEHQLIATRSIPNPFITLSILLLFLALPSSWAPQAPLPAYSPDTTPVGVSCILPQHRSSEATTPILDRFIAETKATASRARIHLWPEGAVAFDSVPARERAVEKVKETAKGSEVWIGMSFDEPDPDVDAREGKREMRRNGMSLVGPDGEVFEYFKRIPVPVAESFVHLPSPRPPPISNISLPLPRETKKHKPIHRQLTLTTSICLDFSQPLPILPSHPSLILAPARTWHPSIGLAMAHLANARAQEIGAAVLWCDGGNGAVSGVYGAGRSEGGGLEGVVQTGNGGTWITHIGLPFVHGEDEGEGGEIKARTLYATWGDWTVAFALVLFVGLGWAYEVAGTHLVEVMSGDNHWPSLNMSGAGMAAGNVVGWIGGGFRLAIDAVRARLGRGVGQGLQQQVTPGQVQQNLIDF